MSDDEAEALAAAAADVVDELEFGALQRLTLRPGDRLVVMQEHELDRTQRALVVHRLQEWAPGYPIMVLPPGVTLGVLSIGAEDLKEESPT